MLNRRDFIARSAATGAVAAAGVAGLAGTADAAEPPTDPDYKADPRPYFSGDEAQQAADCAANNQAIGAALKALGIEHVVVAMMENRSFDHLLSWLPSADGRHDMAYEQASSGNVYPNYPLGALSADPDYQGCGYSDQDHSWEGWLVEANEGALDGFLNPPGIQGVTTTAASNTFSLGWYAAADIPTVAALAQSYTVLDRYFCSFAGETYPNRFYQHSAATDRNHNSGGPGDSATNPSGATSLPAIWDQLVAVPTGSTNGLVAGQTTGAYYFKDVPFLALWGTKYAQFLRPFVPQETSYSFAPIDANDKVLPASLVDQTITGVATGTPVGGTSFQEAVLGGTLPNVSYIDPSFVVEGSGTSGDWHPLCDVRVGDAFIADIYNMLASNGPLGPTTSTVGSYLDTTVLIINFDEWGGFFDHVQPPQVTDVTDPSLVSQTDDIDGADVPDYTQLGFRVPCIMVSNRLPAQVVGSVNPTPSTPAGATDPTTETANHIYDHSSILTMIESLFGLKPIVELGTTPPAGAVGPATRDNFSNNIGAVLTTNPIPLRTDTPAVPTSAALALRGSPISGDQTPCDTTTTKSVSPAPLAGYRGPFGPATPSGVVPEPSSPTTGLPESPLAIGVPLAAATIAGAAIHRRRRDGSVAADARRAPSVEGSASPEG